MSDEDCAPCRVSTAIGMYLNVCKTISDDGGKECDELYEKLVKDEITAKEIFEMVRDKVKDKPDQKDILDYIDDLMAGKTE